MLYAVISGEYPQIAEKFTELSGCEALLTDAADFLPHPVKYHADMQCCNILGRTFVLKNNLKLQNKLLDHDISFELTSSKGAELYPEDVLCNILSMGNMVICNINTVDISIKDFVSSRAKVVGVKQGYTACSVCKVSNNAIITADTGIAAATGKNNIDVLCISEGNIELPGYDYGFIGGCSICFDNTIYFTGTLEAHPDGEMIKKFILSHGKRFIELSNNNLIDIGGAVLIDI